MVFRIYAFNQQWTDLDLNTFDQFQKAVKRVLSINYGEPLNKHISKLKYFPNPLDITHMHAVCYEERGYQLFKFSMSQEVKKGPSQLWLKRISRTNVVLFTRYQRQLNRQSLRQNFFPMWNALDHSYRDRHLMTYYFVNLVVNDHLLTEMSPKSRQLVITSVTFIQITPLLCLQPITNIYVKQYSQ